MSSTPLDENYCDSLDSEITSSSQSDSRYFSYQSDEVLGFNVAHWHMNRSHQKVFRKPKDRFTQPIAHCLFRHSLPTIYRAVHALEFSEDNNYFAGTLYICHIAIGVIEMKQFVVWHMNQALSSQKEYDPIVLSPGNNFHVNSLAISPDNYRIISRGSEKISVHDVER